MIKGIDFFLKKFSWGIHTSLFLLKYFPYVRIAYKAKVGKRVRVINFWYKNKKINVILGRNARLISDIILQGSGNIYIGENSYINAFSVIGCNESVIIGKDVIIANNVSIRDTDHNFADITIPIANQGIVTKPVIIKDNVWIGHGAIITKGVIIEEGAIVGANAVVTKNVERNSIVGGVPAKIIRFRS